MKLQALTTAALVADALRRLTIDVRAFLRARQHRQLHPDTISVHDALQQCGALRDQTRENHKKPSIKN